MAVLVCIPTDVSAFNTLSGFVIAFLPRSKRLLISWRWSLSAVILEPKKIKMIIRLQNMFLIQRKKERGRQALNFYDSFVGPSDFQIWSRLLERLTHS